MEKGIKVNRPWWKSLWCEIAHGHATVLLSDSFDSMRVIRVCYNEGIVILDTDGIWTGWNWSGGEDVIPEENQP